MSMPFYLPSAIIVHKLSPTFKLYKQELLSTFSNWASPHFQENSCYLYMHASMHVCIEKFASV